MPDSRDPAAETAGHTSGNAAPVAADELEDALRSGLRALGVLSPSVPLEDLSKDMSLFAAPRIPFGGKQVPALGGIPLLGRLGKGGMGAVFYGVHTRLEKEVAVKILPPDMTRGEDTMVRRFHREARLAAKIESPHLVRVLDVNEEGGIHFIVQEFVNGISAGTLLRRYMSVHRVGLPEDEALTVILAAVRGLADAHAQDVIHRDVKPDNILIPRAVDGGWAYNKAKLADLGLARMESIGTTTLTKHAIPLGTPGYLAPEQVDPNTHGALTRAADIYGIGTSLYALLCGAPPFGNETAISALMKTVRDSPPPLHDSRNGLRPATYRIVDKCLQKNPTDRFADARELLGPMRECLESPPAQNTAGQAPSDSLGDEGGFDVGVTLSSLGGALEPATHAITELAMQAVEAEETAAERTHRSSQATPTEEPLTAKVPSNPELATRNPEPGFAPVTPSPAPPATGSAPALPAPKSALPEWWPVAALALVAVSVALTLWATSNGETEHRTGPLGRQEQGNNAEPTGKIQAAPERTKSGRPPPPRHGGDPLGGRTLDELIQIAQFELRAYQPGGDGAFTGLDLVTKDRLEHILGRAFALDPNDPRAQALQKSLPETDDGRILRESIAIAEAMNADDARRADLYALLGRVYLEQDRALDAKEKFEIALARAERVHAEGALARVPFLRDLATAHAALNERDEALARLKEALAIAEKQSNAQLTLELRIALEQMASK